MFDMLGNVMRNLTSKPATRKYPFEKRQPFSKSRGQIDIDIETCIFCGICSRKCPSNAISVNKAEKSWEVDHFKCVICSACEDVCPKKSIHMKEEYKTSSYSKKRAKFIQAPKPVETPAQENTQKQ